MKLIIDISDEDYNECKFRKDLLSLGGEPTDLTFNMRIETLIANGIPLPKGHGRLIDANKLISSFPNYDGVSDVAKTIDYAPTVIEADKGE